MSVNLEDRLWDALEPAVVRELERPRFGRTRGLARTAFGAHRLPAAVGVAVVLIALAASAALIAVLGRPAPHPAKPPAHKVTTIGVGKALSDSATGFGAVWTYDVSNRRLLEVDAATHRVVRALAVPGPFVDVAVATGAGAVWAVPAKDSGHTDAGIPNRPLVLVRIDPQSGRSTAATPIRVPGGDAVTPFGIEAADTGVWVWGQKAAVRVDPRTSRVTGAIQIPGDAIRGFTVAGGSVWVATDGKRLLRYDARSGRRTGAFPGRPLNHSISLLATPAAVVIDGGHGTLFARDPASGRLIWEAHTAGAVRSIVYTGDRIWTLTTSATRPTDELVALNPGNGRAVARIGLPTAGGVALEAVGRDLWVTDHDGDLHIVHP
jgi:outer membrane protein assembly factor BamB